MLHSAEVTIHYSGFDMKHRISGLNPFLTFLWVLAYLSPIEKREVTVLMVRDTIDPKTNKVTYSASNEWGFYIN